jgi:acetylornithine deacetylase/succinyl-diaminopimelate desuccinylase-like protein
MPEFPKAINDYIVANEQKFQDRLAKAVEIPSVSSVMTAEGRKHVEDMSDFIADELRKLKNIDVKQVFLGTQETPDGGEINLPKVVIGTLGSNPNNKTILIYGHFDVQPV